MIIEENMRIISGKHRGTKLYTLEGEATRPTLDRVKEPLFSILNFDLPKAVVLDLFAGSGALGLEAISRGADEVVLCDNSTKAIHIIEQNVDKLQERLKSRILQRDFQVALAVLKQEGKKFDIVFLDPPYKTEFAVQASRLIAQYDLLKEDGIIVIETDQKEDVKTSIRALNIFEIYDERKYGRVKLIFMKQKK